MNWVDEVGKRRRRFTRLCEAKQLCVLAGDRVAVRMMDDCVRRARISLQYAEKMDRIGPRIFTPDSAPFAPPALASQDVAATTGRPA